MRCSNFVIFFFVYNKRFILAALSLRHASRFQFVIVLFHFLFCLRRKMSNTGLVSGVRKPSKCDRTETTYTLNSLVFFLFRNEKHLHTADELLCAKLPGNRRNAEGAANAPYVLQGGCFVSGQIAFKGRAFLREIQTYLRADRGSRLLADAQYTIYSPDANTTYGNIVCERIDCGKNNFRRTFMSYNIPLRLYRNGFYTSTQLPEWQRFFRFIFTVFRRTYNLQTLIP